MSQEIQYDEKTVLKLTDKAVKTREEIVIELQRMLILLGTVSPGIRQNIAELAGLLSELVHWMHDESGTHATPSEMLMASFNEARLEDFGKDAVVPSGAGGKKPTIN